MNLIDLTRHALVKRSRVEHPQLALGGIHCDSRRVGPGIAFLAIRGGSTDGHLFVGDALAKGTPALLVTDARVYSQLEAAYPLNLGGLFLLESPRRALAELSALAWDNPSKRLALLGVTGTNGKTTTAFLVGQLLAAMNHPCGVIGTLGMRLEGPPGLHQEGLPVSDRTTPEAPDINAFLSSCLARGAAHAVMEVSSIGVALERTTALRFKTLAFSNLTQDHLDFHGNWENYREAKFTPFFNGQTARRVVNTDDAHGRELVARIQSAGLGESLLTYGLEQPAQLTLAEVKTEVEGTVAGGIQSGGTVAGGTVGLLCYRGESVPFRLPLLGRFNQSNFLAAVGLLLGEGFPLAQLAKSALHCTGAPGRFQNVPVPQPITVVVDYAHTPDALENLLVAARESATSTASLVVVFGAGGDRDSAKRPLMGEVAQRLADKAVLTSDNPRTEDPLAILAEVLSGMDNPKSVEVIENRRDAIYRALNQAQPGDMVVVAGKGDESYQEINGVKHPFDDREVVRDWAQGVSFGGR